MILISWSYIIFLETKNWQQKGLPGQHLLGQSWHLTYTTLWIAGSVVHDKCWPVCLDTSATFFFA